MTGLIHLFRQLFFTRRLYLALSGIVLLFILSYAVTFLFTVAFISGIIVLLTLLADIIVLFGNQHGIAISRKMPDKFSNGDPNQVVLQLKNEFTFTAWLAVIDEVPVQFQLRDFILRLKLSPEAVEQVEYILRPTERGEYWFGDINVMVRSPLGLAERRIVQEAGRMVQVWPSFQTLRKYELLAHTANLSEAGSRKIRRVGHSLEFEEIKEYVSGDDIRNINWKATARRGGQLMVNNFTDERSQQVYCLVDKSRAMKMPFEGMTLLDHAINASLILSQVALIKYDKAGLVTFDENMGAVIAAERRAMQMNRIAEVLYRQQTRFLESDFEKLHLLVRTRITQRSLLVLFTNFESLSSLQRQLPFIRSMAMNHLVLVVFFENTGLKELTEKPVEDIEQLYIKTIAEKFAFEKRLMVKELGKYGIVSLLTPPSQLTINTINKYLELKARQEI